MSQDDPQSDSTNPNADHLKHGAEKTEATEVNDTPSKPSKPRARNTLSRTVILEAAKKISNNSSVEDVTIRKLAKALDVTPMAIYRHFTNKAEILSELLDTFIKDAQVIDHEADDWEAWLHVTFERMLSALSAHPYFLPLLGNAIILGPNAVTVTEKVLSVLKEANIKEECVVNAFFTMLNYTIGSATTRIAVSNPSSGQDQERREKSIHKSQMRIENFSPENHPSITSLAADMAQAVVGEQFHQGLDTIIVGFKATSLPQ